VVDPRHWCLLCNFLTCDKTNTNVAEMLNFHTFLGFRVCVCERERERVCVCFSGWECQIIKHCMFEIAKTVHVTFNKMFEKHFFPTILKTYFVLPNTNLNLLLKQKSVFLAKTTLNCCPLFTLSWLENKSFGAKMLSSNYRTLERESKLCK